MRLSRTLSRYLLREVLQYTLIGITVGMLFYVYSNFRWTLTKDVSEFLAEGQTSAQSLSA